MSFWKFGFGGFNNATIDTLMEKEGLTVADLLDEEETLQECKTHNKKVLEL